MDLRTGERASYSDVVVTVAIVLLITSSSIERTGPLRPTYDSRNVLRMPYKRPRDANFLPR